jgi:hypothetical protein
MQTLTSFVDEHRDTVFAIVFLNILGDMLGTLRRGKNMDEQHNLQLLT